MSEDIFDWHNWVKAKDVAKPSTIHKTPSPRKSRDQNVKSAKTGKSFFIIVWHYHFVTEQVTLASIWPHSSHLKNGADEVAALMAVQGLWNSENFYSISIVLRRQLKCWFSCLTYSTLAFHPNTLWIWYLPASMIPSGTESLDLSIESCGLDHTAKNHCKWPLTDLSQHLNRSLPHITMHIH